MKHPSSCSLAALLALAGTALAPAAAQTPTQLPPIDAQPDDAPAEAARIFARALPVLPLRAGCADASPGAPHPAHAPSVVESIDRAVRAAIAGAAFVEAFRQTDETYFTIAISLSVLIFSEIIPKTAGVVYARPLACGNGLTLFQNGSDGHGKSPLRQHIGSVGAGEMVLSVHG